MKKQYTFRKFINDVHLWLGLPSAVILFFMCFTGTIYVFQKEITQWADAEQFTITNIKNARPIPISQLKAMVEKDKKGTVTSIEIPQYPDQAWTFSFVPKKKKQTAKTEIIKKKNEKVPTKEKTKGVWVNPFSGKIQGNSETSASAFFATVLKLHRWMLIEDHSLGGAITGTASLMMLLLQITGIILWFPAKLKSWEKWQSWKQGFKVKTDAKFKRVNFDLHKAFGFYTFLLVTIMAFTGPYFAFEWYKKTFASAIGTEPANNENTKKSKYTNVSVKPLTMEAIVVKVDSICPYQGNIKINIPKDSLGSVAVLKSQSGFFTFAGVDRITLDQFTGEILELKTTATKNLPEKIISSLKYIHDGEIFGTFTKILYFMACLIATSLPVTGFLIWMGRRKKEKKESKQNLAKYTVS